VLFRSRSSLAALEERDRYTRGHSERVKKICLLLAEDESLRSQLVRIPDGISGLALTAELHDLGKIGIPDAILNKPGKLTEEEFLYIKKHPQKALSILGELSVWLKEDIISGILQHHENFDGTGYPKRAKGGEIHLYARIIRVADALDAMTSNRPYRRITFSLEEAIEELKVHSGNQFDPFIVSAILKLYSQKDIYLEINEDKNKVKPFSSREILTTVS